jgi:hypothetical protein
MGFSMLIETDKPNTNPPVCWNGGNKVVQDHRDGTIDMDVTNRERAQRGLPTPWTSAMGEVECRQPWIW